MRFQKLVEFFPTIREVQDAYFSERSQRKNRQEAVQQLELAFSGEIQDPDDSPLFRIGLALAMSQRRELTKQARDAAQLAVCQLQCRLLTEGINDFSSALEELHDFLSDPGLVGEETNVAARKKYAPDWKVGDTFAYLITIPYAEKCGLSGHYIIFRKVGEYIDDQNKTHQLMYISFCRPDQLPHTEEELRNLGFFPMMDTPEGMHEYWAQIEVNSKTIESFCNFALIGNYSGAGEPKDSADRDPRVAYPLFVRLRREDKVPDFERTLCVLYNQRHQERLKD